MSLLKKTQQVTVLNNDLFEISLMNDMYMIKAKSLVRKYYKLNKYQYRLFCIRLDNGTLSSEDIISVYGDEVINCSYLKIISNIEIIFDSFKVTTAHTKKEIHFAWLTKILNLFNANGFSFLFNKFFLMVVYTAFAFSFPFLFMANQHIGDLSIFACTIWVIVNIFVHEFLHAFALRYYKREVLGVGFKLVYVFPYFFIRTTDIVMCGRKERIMVSLIGPTANVILGLICFIFYFFFKEMFLLNLTYMSYLMAISSLIPFLKSDGYRIFSDIVGDDKISLNSITLLKDFLSRKQIHYHKNIKIYIVYLLINFFIFMLMIVSLYRFFL